MVKKSKKSAEKKSRSVEEKQKKQGHSSVKPITLENEFRFSEERFRRAKNRILAIGKENKTVFLEDINKFLPIDTPG
ncbi:MAG TPA: hypothetical protein PLL89_03600, partial [bacterium]|nr:hypothetical protein [bacterium]